MRTATVFVLIFFAFTLAGCNRAEKDWTDAKQADTVSAYREFLTNHPQGAHVEDARKEIDVLDWKDAQAKGTIEAFDGYLKAHTDGAHADDAKSGINEARDWKDAQAKGTAEAYEGYLTAHSGGPHAEAAKSGVAESSEWEKTAKKGATTSAAYLDFHRKYPDSTRLIAVTADVECSQNLSISMGYGLSGGSAYLRSLNVKVNGHPELSGEYPAEEAGARSLIEHYVERGGIVGKLPQAHLLVTEIKGKQRIVAVDKQ